MRKRFGDYYLGFDIGTGSVGWAATDRSYKLLKFNGKATWGIRLFDTASTAEATRSFRTTRRNLERKSWRLGMLQELFAEEIAKVDRGFFQRLKESNLHPLDQQATHKDRYTLFNDKKYTDKEYYAEYPTIYHLRKALRESRAGLDIRLLYLAVQNILKHRGHFLFAGIDAGKVTDFKSVFAGLEEVLKESLGLEGWCCSDLEQLEAVLKNKNLNISNKKKELEKLLPNKGKQEKAIIAFLNGSKGKLSELFYDWEKEEPDAELAAFEKNSFSMADGNFEELYPLLEEVLKENIIVVEALKAVYDWSILVNILQGEQYLSNAKVKAFAEHRQDLTELKTILTSTCPDEESYKKIFKSQDKEAYEAYAKGVNGYGQSDFCKNVLKTLTKSKNKKLQAMAKGEKASEAGGEPQGVIERLMKGIAFPKPTGKENSVIPLQVQLVELKAILENQAQYHEFLNAADEQGMPIKEKIIDIVKFRVPYYVGPLAGTELSRAKGRCWSVRKNSDKIYPWNFEQVIDTAASAEAFITKMTSKCTYLIGEDVLPKASLLYSEFVTRNEFNNLSLDGERMKPELINMLYEELLVQPKGNGKITRKKLAECLQAHNIPFTIIGGVDDAIKNNLRSFKDFREIFGEAYVFQHKEQIENIIKWITLFGESKQLLKEKITSSYPEIKNEQIKQILKLKYKDWGRLSEKLLCSSEIAHIDESTGEFTTIISAMRKTNKNLMELLGAADEHGFAECISRFNGLQRSEEGFNEKMLEELYVSPAVKRSIWQTYSIMKELAKVFGHEPARVFIETTREPNAEKKRTTSRLQRLKDLYNSCRGEEAKELLQALEAKSEEDLRSDRLYLYYTQMGKCMYSGEPISLAALYDKNTYDVDHIFPQSKTKDDSLENRVLVRKDLNLKKSDEYPLSSGIQAKMQSYWKMLLDKGLIGRKKYERLTRRTSLTKEELAGFISRQLVETSQSTKAVAEVIKQVWPKTEVVYVKAKNVSEFRQEFNMLKCRSVNDLHHAKDAYLNIVVGNVYHTKFTKNPLNYIKNMRPEDKYTLNTKKLYNYPIEREGITAWVPGEEGSMKQVQGVMQKNNILFTRHQVVNKGQLYKLQLVKAGEAQVPAKKGRNVDLYGGYNAASTAYFALVESIGKKGSILRTLESISIMADNNSKKDPMAISQYLEEVCKLKSPKILIPKIKKYALINLDGCMLHITGKSGDSITAKVATQLVLGYEWECYFKRVTKFIQRYTESKGAALITAWDEITKEKNLELYHYLIYKHECNAYKNRPSKQIATLKNGEPAFRDLSVEKQCIILGSILELFQCAAVRVNLEDIGGSKNAGTITVGKDITNRDCLRLINQSITGLFEQEVNLLQS